MAATTYSTPEITKRIGYNRANRDYDCFVAIDGGEERYIGSASTYGQGETTCNQYAYDYYSDNDTPEKAVELLLQDTRTPEELAYDNLKDGSIYATPADQPTVATFTAALEAEARTILDYYEPFGTLSDGTPIYGHTDELEPSGRAGVVSVDVGGGDGFRITAQDAPNLVDIEGESIRIEGASIEQINALRALLLTDIPEQALASAAAYGRGDDPPPPTAPASAVTVEHDEGTITYRCGTNAIYFDPDYAGGVQLAVFDCSAFELQEVESGLPDLVALMADPRVQAARVRYEAGAPLMKAA